MNRFFHSLMFKIGFTIIVIEVVIFSTMGVYQNFLFHKLATQRLKTHLQTVGNLLSQSVLNYTTVTEAELMTQLVDGRINSSMLIEDNGTVIYSSEPAYVGKKFSTLPGIHTDWVLSEMTVPIFLQTSENQSEHIHSFIPVFNDSAQAPELFIYIKAQIKQTTSTSLSLFFTGFMVNIIITSLAIVLFFRQMIQERIHNVITVLRILASGDVTARVREPEFQDEIWQLQHDVNVMAAEFQRRFEQLTEEAESSRQTEADLIDECNLLRDLIDNLPALAYLKDCRSRFIFANDETVHSVGATIPEELIGKTDFEFHPPELARQYYNEEQHIIHTGQPMLNKEELVIERKTGSKRWFLTTKIPFRDHYGNISGIMGLNRDITERRMTEEALRKSENLIHSLVESLPQNIYSKDLKGRFTFVNQSYCELHGKSFEELVGKNDFDLHPPELAQKYLKDDLRVIETGEIFKAVEVHQIENKEATYVQIIKTPLYDVKGEVTGTMGIFWDITQEKKTVEALQKSELLYRTTINAMYEAIYVIDSEFRVTLCNSALLHWIRGNFSESDIIGQSIFRLFQPLPQNFHDDYQQVFKTGESLVSEEILSIGENEFTTETQKIPVREHGKVSQIITVIRDITKDKIIKKTIQESNERYRNLVENAPLGILSIDTQGKIREVNAMLVATFGSPSAEAMNQFNVFTSPPVLEAEMFSTDFQQCIEMEIPLIEEHPYTTVWEKSVYLRYYLTPIRNIDGEVKEVYAIFEDCTDRKMVERALKESETEYRSLFKNMLSGLAYYKIVVDEQGQPIDYIFLEINEAFERLTGLESAEVIGRRVTEVIPGIRNYEPDLIRIYGNVALTGKETTFEFFFEPFGVWQSVSAYSSEKGYFVTIFDDITERKWAEESLRKLNEELEQRVKARTNELRRTNKALQESLKTLERTQSQLVQSEKMAALGGLVAGIAHEINTPVGVGVTAASYLSQRTEDIFQYYHKNLMRRSDFENYLELASDSTTMILVNLQRAADLIQSFKQVAVDQTSWGKRTFKLKEYIDKIFLSLHPKLKRTQHKVNVSCPEDYELNSYPGAFSQIITNLVINSLVHGFETIEQGEIIIDISKIPGTLVLHYHDNGKGIPQENLAKIFEPFYTTKRGQGGSGLGLHIVYNLVTQRLNGRIECESTEGVGTTFIIQLPIQPITSVNDIY